MLFAVHGRMAEVYTHDAHVNNMLNLKRAHVRAPSYGQKAGGTIATTISDSGMCRQRRWTRSDGRNR